MALRVAELEALVTVNTDDLGRAEKGIKATGQRIEKSPVKVGVDNRSALERMDAVETAAKKIVSAKTIATVDANVERGEAQLARVRERLDYLRSVETELDVKADVSRAEAQLQRVSRNLDGLRSARATMEVDADTAPAEAALKSARGAAGAAGDDAGAEFGSNIVAALVSIPIAGAVIGIGVAAGKALVDGLNDGLQIEKGFDRLQALTGVDEASALRLGRAAGEAYANNFGESIEANMDTTRLALQFDIIDESATTRDAQKVVQSLGGISDVLGEDVRPIAQAVTQLLSTGLVKSADQAFDIIATGAREGVNRNEDLLDTLTEYPSLFQQLGLSGEEALGLINQGMKAGARNSDLAADALKEFQIRATDAAGTYNEGFRLVGLNAEEMQAKIAAGGEGAREGLDQVLDGLRAIEDPMARNAAAAELFGTQAEDLGGALFAMDLSSAVDELDGVTGAAQRMFDTMAGNDASKIEQAQRNIEVAADGIKGALAAAFAEPLGELADFVSQNRGPVMQFLLDLANGALDFGVSMINATADGTEALGSFVSGPGADMLQLVANLQKSINPFADTSALDATIESMRGFDEVTGAAADTMRTEWVGSLEEARGRLNEFGDGAVALALVNDASLRLATAIDGVGVAADGTAASGAALEGQVLRAVEAMRAEIDAARAAGESQANLEERHKTATDALMGQLQAMGLTEQAARDLIAAGGTVVVDANISEAQRKLDQFIRDNASKRINVAVGVGGAGGLVQGTGGIVEFMAAGGIRGASPMAPIAQVVPASTWRVVGDRSDVPEAYIPMDGSARSMGILLETMRRMGVIPMGDGGVVAQRTEPSRGAVVQQYIYPRQDDPRIQMREWAREAKREFSAS